VREYEEMTRFQHVAEMLHGLVDSQFEVGSAVFLLCWIELLGKVGEGLPGVVDTWLQHRTHGEVCQWCGARQTRLALIESPVEFRRPGDGMRTLGSGAGENVMERCLGSSSVGQKPPIKVEHAEEATVFIFFYFLLL
jgi:hypothetical protein